MFVTVVERYGLSAAAKKSGRCREVAVGGGSTGFLFAWLCVQELDFILYFERLFQSFLGINFCCRTSAGSRPYS